MDRKKEFLIRVYVVMAGFILVGIILASKAFIISNIEGDKWRKMADELYFKLISIEAERGKILADDGSPLAISLPFFEIRMDTKAKGLTKEVFKKNVDSLAICLANDIMLDQTPAEIKNWLIKERQRENRYLLIARSLDFQQYELLKSFPIFRGGQNKGGLIVIRKDRREKPFKFLASRTIGLNRENAQSIGLESSFDSFLKGVEGQCLMKKVGDKIYLPVDDVNQIEAKKGSDIVTTINVGIQEVAEEALAEALTKHNADKGCAVVMEVKTGAIKAIANLGKNPAGEYVEDFNYAVGLSTEPGSTMKLASTLALLDDGHVDLKTPVDINGGSCYFYNKKMNDSKMHGYTNVDLQFAFEQSSNVGISKLAWSVFSSTEGQKKFAQYYEKFGLLKKTGIALEGEPKPLIKNPVAFKDKWYGTTLPWMSVGYEMLLTPLQILNFYNAIANGGKMMKPLIVSSVVDDDNEISTYRPKVLVDSIASESALLQINALLKGVLESGTAKAIKSEQYSISGKTGTAVTNYFVTGFEKKDYQASFCGFFPSENPIYSCIVVVYNPTQGGFYGGEAAAPVFRKIADRCMRDINRVAYQVNEQPNPVLAVNVLPIGNHGFAKDFEKLFSFIGLPYHNQQTSSWVRTISDHDGVYTLPQQKVKGQMPDLTGMGLRDALFIMDEFGIETRIKGVGKVVWQSVQTGTYDPRITKSIDLLLE
ncbi:MAG: transpeptidase family protein [Saprospiraceae bacterium]|nr:transpeptidase family protein [Candidatus Defluviibacterium haderslevense]